jgi:valyl-tRNA synthetase
MSVIDRWIRSRYARLVQAVTASFESFDFDKAARALYDFVWSEFCDWYLELAKVDLYREDLAAERRQAIQHTLWTVLEGTLRLLHPIMPHITEEVWQSLPHRGESIVVAPWPQADTAAIDESAEDALATLMAVVRAIRSMRADLGLAPTTPVAPVLRAPGAMRGLLENHRAYLMTLGRAPGVAIGDGPRQDLGTVGTVAGGVEVSLEVAEPDRARARKRLAAELAAVRADLDRTVKKLADTTFVLKAPTEVVEEERRRQADLQERTRILAGYLAALG